MNRTRRPVVVLLSALLLVSAQAVAFAHGIDEASHPVQTVCDLCVAGHSLGSAAAVGQLSWTVSNQPDFVPVAQSRSIATVNHRLPRQRGPPATC